MKREHKIRKWVDPDSLKWRIRLKLIFGGVLLIVFLFFLGHLLLGNWE